MKITFDLQKTKQRKQELNEYFQDSVLVGEKFICDNFTECKKSHPEIFYDGQLHHVGSYYDAYISNRSFRIMVVGQEYGHGPNHVSMKDRTHMVLDQTGLQKNFAQRNPHMRGTTSALRLLYGIPLGTDYASEFIQVNSEKKCHIFDAFALVNYLLCSAVSEDKGRRGRSTDEMKDNCCNHFRAALKILEPNVIIIQSKGYWPWIRSAFDKVSPISNELYRVKTNENIALVAVFAHPSTPDNKHNWGRDDKTPYLLEIVAPTIGIIHRELLDEDIQSGDKSIKLHSEESTDSGRKKTAISSISNYQYEKIAVNRKDGSEMIIQYDEMYSYMEEKLLSALPKEVLARKPKFKVRSNRLQIYLDRITGSHYEICMRMDYHEIALHFESTPERSLQRRQQFDPHLEELSQKLGQSVRSGKHENRGWMRVWIKFPKQEITDSLARFYTQLFSRFIAETFPILRNIYEQEEIERQQRR